MQSENLAIVFIDIVGFTARTSKQSREENEAMLTGFDRAVRPLVRGFDGRVIKTMGDAFLLTYRSPTNAVHCAMAIIDELTREHQNLPEDQVFEIRAAINVGEVRIDGGDIFGEAVNIASRIEGKAPAGEIYFSEAVYLSMTRSEVPSEEVGTESLKGIPEPVRLYRVPRVAEIGPYRMSGMKISNGVDSGAGEEGPLDPVDLPFGGYSLDKAKALPSLIRRSTLERLMDGARLKAPEVIEGARSGMESSSRRITRSMGVFLERYHSSRHLRWIVIGVAAALLIGGIALIIRPKPKPLSPWQKLQRSIGID